MYLLQILENVINIFIQNKNLFSFEQYFIKLIKEATLYNKQIKFVLI